MAISLDATCTCCGAQRRLVRGMIVGRPPTVICDGCVEELFSKVCELSPTGSTAICALCRKGEQQRRWFRRRSVPLATHRSGLTVCAACILLCEEVVRETWGRRPRDE